MLGDEGDPSASHVALTDEKEKVQRALPQVRSHFRPAVMDSVMPPQDLAAALYKRYISLSPFPREQEFPTAGSCQLARPSCASGKVNWALCPLQDESRTIVLRDVNQGCAYLRVHWPHGVKHVLPSVTLACSMCRGHGVCVGSA